MWAASNHITWWDLLYPAILYWVWNLSFESYAFQMSFLVFGLGMFEGLKSQSLKIRYLWFGSIITLGGEVPPHTNASSLSRCSKIRKEVGKKLGNRCQSLVYRLKLLPQLIFPLVGILEATSLLEGGKGQREMLKKPKGVSSWTWGFGRWNFASRLNLPGG